MYRRINLPDMIDFDFLYIYNFNMKKVLLWKELYFILNYEQLHQGLLNKF